MFDAITNIKRHELQQRIMDDQAARLGSERKQKSMTSMEYKLQKAEKVAMESLNKEIRYESLMEQEIKQATDDASNQLEIELEQQKEKKVFNPNPNPNPHFLFP